MKIINRLILSIVCLLLIPLTIQGQTSSNFITITTLDELMTVIAEANMQNIDISLSLEDDIVLERSISIGTTVYFEGNGHTISGQNLTGIFSISRSGELILNNIILTDGNTNEGGAIHNSGDLRLSNTIITNNIAEIRGGGIYTANPAIIVNTTISNNTSALGGAIFSFGNIDIDNTIIDSNTSTREGGGIYLYGNGYTRISNTIISNNVAELNGGGLYSAVASTSVIITNSLFSGNISNQSGGAIANMPINSMDLINVTISGNEAMVDGGGVFMAGANGISMNNVTVSNNSALNNAGGVSGVSNARITNTIIANNSASNNNNCVDVSGDTSNLSDEGCDGFGLITPNTDYETTLADNGGFTPTHALIEHGNNPAIDTANAFATQFDQRNYQVVNMRDIGAFEINPIVPIYAVASFNEASASLPEPDEGSATLFSSVTVSRLDNFAGVLKIYMLAVSNSSANLATDISYYLGSFEMDCAVEDCTTLMTFDIGVPIFADNLFENDEQFEIILFGSKGFTIDADASRWQATIEAIPTTVTLDTTINAETGLEEFAVNLGSINATGVPVTVNYIVEGTAIAGEDYVSLSGNITILNGEQYASIPINPIEEDIYGDGTVTLTLSDTDNPLAVVDTTPITLTLVTP